VPSGCARALNRLGPTYVKFGQYMRRPEPDIVGATVAADLSQLQDRMAPFEPGACAGHPRTARSATAPPT